MIKNILQTSIIWTSKGTPVAVLIDIRGQNDASKGNKKMMKMSLKLGLKILTVMSVLISVSALADQAQLDSLDGFNKFQQSLTLVPAKNYLPNNIDEDDNATVATQKILTHNIETVGKDASLVKSIQQINNKVGSSILISEADPNDENAINHKFAFNLKAFESKATMAYEGLVKAEINYVVSNNNIDLNISKRVTNSTTLSFIVNQNEIETTNLLGFNYNW